MPFTSSGATGFAQTVSLNLSKYLSQAPKPAVSDTFRPLHLRYLSYDNSANDFKLDLDKGSLIPNPHWDRLPKNCLNSSLSV